MNLRGKKVLLGITGSIAAYKACELLRILQKRGAAVRVVMTEDAVKFIKPMTFAVLSNFPVYVKNSADSNPLIHIDYSQWADFYIIAPCSATSLARFVSGTGEEPVSLCFLAGPKEKWIVPAMNCVMYNSPAVQKNLEILRSYGVKIIEPVTGHLACGQEGAGKFPEPEDIADELEFFSADIDKTLLITIGRTQEAIDPVRYISNHSSGKTGAEIAKAFLREGWKVIAVCGPMEAKLPKQCEIIEVKDSQGMNNAALAKQAEANVIAHCAAVADYRPKQIASQKIKNSRAMQKLELEETANILKNTIENKKKYPKNSAIVSFALETENALENAEKKFENGGMDILVVNTAANFGKDIVEYGFFTKSNRNPEMEHNSKEMLALQLFNEVKNVC